MLILNPSSSPYRSCAELVSALGRKVRTPQCDIVANGHPPWGEEKCNRKYVQVRL